MRFLIFLCCYVASVVVGYPTTSCPIQTSGMANDLGFLSEVVSWDGGFQDVSGVCGIYKLLHESDGMYDTRMRVYTSDDDRLVVVFRPTQQTDQGGQIHVARRLVPCTFIPSCSGLVHERFQDAFFSLVSSADWGTWITNTTSVYTAGHSLGGALQIFFGVYSARVLGKTPTQMLGLAGPFIGDRVFNHHHLEPLKTAVPSWWQVEDVNQNQMDEYDGTVEGYNVDQPPYIAIVPSAVCSVIIPKLADSYGMHDLRNYRLALTGTVCE